MHPAAHQWARSHIPEHPQRVVEIGGADWNGGVRSCFAWSHYVAVDLHRGKGVDVVADFTTWANAQPEASYDLVICLEVFEHTPTWPAMLAASRRLLEPGGLMIGTCATGGRAPHGATGAPHPAQGEHYANVGPGELADGLLAAGFLRFQVDVARSALDLRWVAWAS